MCVRLKPLKKFYQQLFKLKKSTKKLPKSLRLANDRPVRRAVNPVVEFKPLLAALFPIFFFFQMRGRPRCSPRQIHIQVQPAVMFWLRLHLPAVGRTHTPGLRASVSRHLTFYLG